MLPGLSIFVPVGICCLKPRKRVLLTDLVVRRSSSYTTNGQPINNWFLSGIGKGIAWEGRAPPTTYDARDVIEDEDKSDVGDRVVAYKKRYVVAACPFPPPS